MPGAALSGVIIEYLIRRPRGTAANLDETSHPANSSGRREPMTSSPHSPHNGLALALSISDSLKTL